MNKRSLSSLIGIELNPSSHVEKIVSGLGACLAIYAVYSISHRMLAEDAMLIVASMGAASVLLFAVPHGPLSQPWPLFGGNIIAAIIGVTCAQWIPDIYIAAAAAVGLSITAMYYLKCIHPPAGATALSAVISGSAVNTLGFSYVLAPVLCNVVVIFCIAVLFNYPFKWRRYPASLIKQTIEPISSLTVDSKQFSHESIAFALREIDSFIDISEEDLNRIYQLASEFDNRQNNSAQKTNSIQK